MKHLRILLSCTAAFAAMGMGAQAQDSGPIRIGVLTDISGQFSHEAGEGRLLR